MRMFLLFILLICPMTARAVVTAAYCAQFNSETCSNIAGCHCDDVGNCVQCDEQTYCPEGHNNQPISCGTATSHNFSNSPRGSTSINDCYKQLSYPCKNSNGEPIDHCGMFHPRSKIKCWDDNGIYNDNYHMEGQQCYYNTLACSQFGQSECGTAQVLGHASWQDDDHWALNSCTCTQTDTNYTDKHCKATMTKIPNPQTISSVGTIHYEIDWYYCKTCDAGHYVHATDGFNQSANPGCSAQYLSGDKAVCKCTDAPKGYYSAGFAIDYSITDIYKYANEPYLNPCPAGQTTQTTGATSAQQCEYNGNTQFCDAKGCFTLGTDFENWIFPN